MTDTNTSITVSGKTALKEQNITVVKIYIGKTIIGYLTVCLGYVSIF